LLAIEVVATGTTAVVSIWFWSLPHRLTVAQQRLLEWAVPAIMVSLPVAILCGVGVFIIWIVSTTTRTKAKAGPVDLELAIGVACLIFSVLCAVKWLFTPIHF
jgi:hypothetical protein